MLTDLIGKWNHLKVRVNWNAHVTDSHKRVFKNEIKVKYCSGLLGPNDELRIKCPNAEFFWSEYSKIRSRKNSVFGQFSRNDEYKPYLKSGIYEPSVFKNFKLKVKIANSNVLNKLHLIVTWEDHVNKEKRYIITNHHLGRSFEERKMKHYYLFYFPFFFSLL